MTKQLLTALPANGEFRPPVLSAPRSGSVRRIRDTYELVKDQAGLDAGARAEVPSKHSDGWPRRAVVLWSEQAPGGPGEQNDLRSSSRRLASRAS